MELERLKNKFAWDINTIARYINGYWKIESRNGHTIEYPEEGNNNCFELEEQSFWFKNRSLIIGEFWKTFSTSNSFWEIGAGNGYVSSCLKKIGAQCVTVEPGSQGAKNSAKRGLESICGFLQDLNLPNNSIPCIGCFDVLEHLDHPEEIIKEFHRILELNGKVLITVPAHKKLWSQTDEMSFHKRRYEIEEVINLMTSSGFKKVRCSYFMTSMVLPLYWLRARPFKKSKIFDTSTLAKDQRAQMLGPSSKLFNLVINTILGIERVILRYKNLPTGTSIIGVFSKE
jgi:ubiquinone/menaquinone biosynthesis C-methylase UbiE